jgi:alpha-galactosidase
VSPRIGLARGAAAAVLVFGASVALAADPASGVRVERAVGSIVLRTPSAAFTVLPSGGVQAQLLRDGRSLGLDVRGDAAWAGAEVQAAGRVLRPAFDLPRAQVGESSGLLGSRAQRVEVPGHAGDLEATLAVEVADDFPGLALVRLAMRNAGTAPVKIERVSFLRRRLDATRAGKASAPSDLWSFHGASTEWGLDDVVRLSRGFARVNPLGPGRPDGFGGGVPVVAFWTATAGTALGHVETTPIPVSIPVRTADDGRVETALTLESGVVLTPGATYRTPTGFVSAFAGDFYEALRTWSLALQRRGWKPARPSDEAYEVSWCGWGYEFNVTPAQMTGTIPKLKELGIHWATLDDRWFADYGDWEPRADTFPGDAIRTMVEAFHRQGLKVQLWWFPVGAEDGVGRYESHAYRKARVVEEHPDWLILGPDGRPARLTRGLAALCPALPEVQRYYKTLTERFVRDWGFDGHKLDLSFSVPACHNPKHGHRSPQESVDALGRLYQVIFEATRALKPESVTQSCPCGTPPNPAWLPFLDQAVTADPVGGAQVRRRIKMYKALLGPEAAVYGDHVELSQMKRQGDEGWIEIGRDFASTIGPGGVVGTKFTWPEQGSKYARVFLDTAKDAHWKKWIALYNSRKLSRGTFRNLYVLGYDVPEGYAIEKDGRLFYAFFAPEPETAFEGEVELRGLAGGRYAVRDWENDRPLGTVETARARLPVRFTGHLLLEAAPEGSR